ncbi:hypothetical protein CLAVI_000323 [Candidatus Clavichlamydia salmonicola]|uniref:hypothetical protein n=1 Tax=Candidatus Clavichlamydia salmonicola TaxID=469812 RepID=UPI00189102EE|nr:hypothetical protein [Candidatus Clavichlamydia salmonicola]MBF5050708.1 hypothetical protein [Candidatus Clavichlamydia salmonicola]
MSVFCFREQRGRIREEVPINLLSRSSPFIELWKKRLSDFFFGSDGILVNQRACSSNSRRYLVITSSFVLAENSLLGKDLVKINLTSYELPKGEDFSQYLENVQLSIEALMQMSREGEEERVRIVCLKINDLFLRVKILNLSAFIQLLASLLWLYKDFLDCTSFTLGDVKIQALKQALEQLPERAYEERGCSALKEMLLQAKIWISGCLEEEDEKVLPSPELDALLLNLIGIDINRRLEEKEKSQLLCLDPSNEKNIVTYISNISLEMLIIILQEMPKEILGKILLELPPSIVCGLKQKMDCIFRKEQLMKEIYEKLSELQLLGKANQLSQQDKTRVVLPLSSLSAIAICKSQSRSIGSSLKQPLACWGASYINMLLQDRPEIERNIQKRVRVGIQCPETCHELVFERAHHPGYSNDHDLFSLASMLPGYDDFIKKALIERCVQN